MSSFPFQRSVAKACQFIRNFARKVILERQEAVLRGENTPPDILAHILSVAQKEPSITVEDLIDDFTTFFIAGMYFHYQNLVFNSLSRQTDRQTDMVLFGVLYKESALTTIPNK